MNLDTDSIMDSLGVGNEDNSEATQKKLEIIRKRFDICMESTAQNRQEMLDDIRFARLAIGVLSMQLLVSLVDHCMILIHTERMLLGI